MKKTAMAAALLALAAAGPAGPATAAQPGCYTPADLEAEQALVFLTDLMVVSSSCQQDDLYARFRLRNQYAIISYQREMITHFRHAGYRAAKHEFDRWNTNLANEISLQDGNLPTAQVCQNATAMFKLASTLDPAGFHRYAAAQAQSAVLKPSACQ